MAREMKDSGIEWIGEISNDFKVVRLKFLLKEPLLYGANESGIQFDEKLPRYIRITDIDSNGTLKGTGKLSLSMESASGFILKDGDVLFARSGASVGKTFLYYEKYGLSAFAGYLIRARLNELVKAKYFYYYTQSSAYESWKNQFFIQSTIQNIGADRYCQLPVVISNLSSQEQIVSFLDTQCAHIDSVIEKTRVAIEEYKKLKQAVITRAVTKGIRPNREMKDSGIEWIGEIPKKWSITKANRVIDSTQNGLSRRDIEKSTGQIVLKLKNISTDGKIDYSYVNRIALTEQEIKKYSLQDGDFLFVRVNGSKSLVGKCAIYQNKNTLVAYNDHIIRVRLNRFIIKRFFQLYLQSEIGRTEIDLRTSTAAGQFTISGEGLREILVIVPPLFEQSEIVAYLDEKTAAIDSLIQKKEQLITELEAYKKSLIYEYVTGKKEAPAHAH